MQKIPTIESKLPTSGYYEPCTTTDPELFFPRKGEASSVGAAKNLCHTCESENMADCLTRAMAIPDTVGVWAATTGRDRRRIRKTVDPADIGSFISEYVEEKPSSLNAFVTRFNRSKGEAAA